MGMAKSYKIRSVIVCDDVRREISKKEILIGVYTDAIVVQQVPAVLPLLHFRVNLSVTKDAADKFSFYVEKPSGARLLDTKDQSYEKDGNVILVMAMHNPILDEVGQHRMYLQMGSARKEMIGEFNVTVGSVAE